jgi:hypothetical protein
MSGGSVSMSGMPAAARPPESISRRARRCAFSDSGRVIFSSRTSDQSKSHLALAVLECAVDVGLGSGLPDVFRGFVVMVVLALEVVAVSAAAVAVAMAETVALSATARLNYGESVAELVLANTAGRWVLKTYPSSRYGHTR